MTLETLRARLTTIRALCDELLTELPTAAQIAATTESVRAADAAASVRDTATTACTHPPKSREDSSGFGRGPRTFYCHACKQTVVA